MPTNVIVGLCQVLVPFVGQVLISKGILPADSWTQIGAIVVAVAGAGWSANTTHLTPPVAK